MTNGWQPITIYHTASSRDKAIAFAEALLAAALARVAALTAFLAGDPCIITRSSAEFEAAGVDVLLRATWSVTGALPGHFEILANHEARIEIKPSVGDDYPSVLRQMKAQRADVLFLDRYSGSGINEQQFKDIFANEKISVLFRHDVG